MKLVKVARTKDMLKVVVDGEEKWVDCSPAVKGYVANTFEEGEELNAEYEEGEGNAGGILVTRVTKAGAPKKTTKKKTPNKKYCSCGKEIKGNYNQCYDCNQNNKSTGKKCSICGKTLKNPAYDKCYSCAQKDYKKNKPTRSSSTNESIKRQAIGHMTSRTLISLQGQVDEDNIEGLMERIYAKYQELVG